MLGMEELLRKVQSFPLDNKVIKMGWCLNMAPTLYLI